VVLLISISAFAKQAGCNCTPRSCNLSSNCALFKRAMLLVYTQRRAIPGGRMLDKHLLSRSFCWSLDHRGDDLFELFFGNQLCSLWKSVEFLEKFAFSSMTNGHRVMTHQPTVPSPLKFCHVGTQTRVGKRSLQRLLTMQDVEKFPSAETPRTGQILQLTAGKTTATATISKTLYQGCM